MTKEEQIALDAWRDAEAWLRARGEYYADAVERVAAKYEAYRELVVNDVRPPVVDRAREVAQLVYEGCAGSQGLRFKTVRDYGNERFAEGERAGIERAIEWSRKHEHWPNFYDHMRRDLLNATQPHSTKLGEPKMKPADVTDADRELAKRIVLEFIGREYRAKEDEVARLFAHRRIAAFEAGRVAGLEETAKVMEAQNARDHVRRIRALKEKNDG